MDRAKMRFAVSSYSLEKGHQHRVLDNYIKNNNPQYKIEENKIFRNSKADWVKDGEYVDQKTKKYLKLLSARLEEIHSIHKSEKYWKQMFYIGLKRYISLTYEFFKQIETRFDKDAFEFSILDKSSFYTPYDLEDLRDYLSNSESAQEQLFAIYWTLFYSDESSSSLNIDNEFKLRKFKSEKDSSLDERIDTKTEMLVFGTGCDRDELENISFLSNRKIKVYNFLPFNQFFATESDCMHRSKISSFESDFDKFDTFFFRTLESLCPTVLIEDYHTATNYYEAVLQKFSNLKYIMSEVWISNHQMSFFIAQARERGVAFLYNEHNGLLHPFINNFVQDFAEIVDTYLTIGWKNKNVSQRNFVTAGIIHSRYDRDKISQYVFDKKNDNKILYMTAPIYAKRTNYNGINFFMGEDSKYYFNFQEIFFSNLADDVISNIKYRAAPIFQIRNWLTYSPKTLLGKYLAMMEHDTLELDGVQAMLNSKVVVIDYLGSGYLHALMLNVPTLLFLNENCYFDDMYADLFQELIEADVIQTNAAQAASFLTKIEKSPYEWWQSSKVQSAKNNFLDKVIKGGTSFKDVLFTFLDNGKKRTKDLTKLNLEFYKNKDLYSDGDVENEILHIVKYSDDYSEILSETDKWPILYHLTPHRKNLLEWYEFDKEKSLLEIGGGCGAFSGMFAEKLKEVKVIELSKRRSEIIYHRHQNYNNLEILVGNLNDIKLDKKFDYITLIGVLEYAGKFTQGSMPFDTFLKQVKQHLQEDGKLLVAIENKFGLKYWAGAKEDHTGRYFDSIENYPQSKDIQTFGKYEIEQLLFSIGFKHLEFYYPMPDYKLPNIVYSDSFLPAPDSFFNIYSPNFDNERYVLFNEREAFKNVIANKQFPFFANSFLIEASL